MFLRSACNVLSSESMVNCNLQGAVSTERQGEQPKVGSRVEAPRLLLLWSGRSVAQPRLRSEAVEQLPLHLAARLRTAEGTRTARPRVLRLPHSIPLQPQIEGRLTRGNPVHRARARADVVSHLPLDAALAQAGERAAQGQRHRGDEVLRAAPPRRITDMAKNAVRHRRRCEKRLETPLVPTCYMY